MPVPPYRQLPARRGAAFPLCKGTADAS
jgi:hypothetical protein